MKTTKIIKMCEFIKTKTSQTTMAGSDESVRHIQADCLARHARTMILMFNATGEQRYLHRARLDVLKAKSILRSGYMRPLGVLLKSA